MALSFSQTTIPIQIYRSTGWYYLTAGAILGGLALAYVAGTHFLPPSFTQEDRFYDYILLPVYLIVLYFYYKKVFMFKNTELKILPDRSIYFRDEKYSARDIHFYEYKLQGVNCGSIISLDNGRRKVSLMATGCSLEDEARYEGDWKTSYFNNPNLAIEEPGFETISALALKQNR